MTCTSAIAGYGIDLTSMLPNPVLPAAWVLAEQSMDGRKWQNHVAGFAVIVSIAREDDGEIWIHFSMSHRDRIPTWEEFVAGKEMFLGRESKAIQVIPPRSQYVNLNPNVLHLFVCHTADVLPDFTRGWKTL